MANKSAFRSSVHGTDRGVSKVLTYAPALRSECSVTAWCRGAMALNLIRTFDRVVGMCVALLTELALRRRSGRNAREEAQMFAQRISRRIIPLAVTCVAVICTATSTHYR